MREEQVVKISKALKNTTCQEAQNATGHSVVTFFFFFSFFHCQQPAADSLTKSRIFPQLSEYINNNNTTNNNPSATDTGYLSQ